MVEVKIERERKLPDWLTLPLMVLAGPFLALAFALISVAIICIVVPMAIITVACKLTKRFYKFWTSNFESAQPEQPEQYHSGQSSEAYLHMVQSIRQPQGVELRDSMDVELTNEEPEYTETHGRRPRGLDLDE